ncbi:MAG: alpha/beta fold hydrolase [Streptosporangiaceae bacterium]
MGRRKAVEPAFAATRVGEGPPVVLIHGIGHRRQAWDPIVPAVSAEREVIAIDLPGFGESPGLPEDMTYDMPTTMENFAKAFAELGLERPHVVGNSLGGAIAIELGALDLARSVTALSPAGFWNAVERRYALALLNTVRMSAAVPDRLLTYASRSALVRNRAMSPIFAHPERVAPEDFLADARLLREAPAFAPTVRAGHSYDCLATPVVPTTVAWGEKDRILPPRQVRLARRRLPDARFVRLPGCGHVPMIDDPELVAKVILQATAGE